MVTVSEIANKKIKELQGEEPDNEYLRVFVKGGGCSGYSYGMAFENASAVKDDDNVIEKDGVKIVIDPQSAPLVNGSVVDYTDGLQGSGFALKNPQAKTTCGCGSSFSV